MKKLLLTLISLLALAPALNAQCTECMECPSCGTEMAVGFLKKTKESKTVYEVKQKEITIPNICLPCCKFNLRQQLRNLCGSKWCPGKPCGGCETGDCPKRLREGTIKVVNVMSKKKVKCDACAYEWEVADMEDVNAYLYDIEPASESDAKPAAEPKAATPEAPPVESAPAEADSAPVEVEELPLMEVPAAPKMGWQRPSFNSKKKEPIVFAPQQIMGAPTTISTQPQMITTHPSTITTSSTATFGSGVSTEAIPAASIKAVPASTSNSFLIRRPGPKN